MSDPWRWPRRAAALGAVALVASLVPALLLIAILLDHGAPWKRTRSVLMLGLWSACELGAMPLCVGLWLFWRGPAFVEANHRLQRAWCGVLIGGMKRILGLRFQVEGDEVGPGPVLMLVRHASAGDALLPMELAALRHGLRMRYVLKAELLWDPCLDIVGQRIPNAFVRRGSGDADAEAAKIRQLAQGMGDGDCLALYPEGTRFSVERRNRALQGKQALAAARLVHTLPPKLAGVQAALDGHPAMDLVVCAHSGMEAINSLADLARGGLVDRTVKVRCRRIARSEVPEALDEWLLQQWMEMDRWIGEQS